MMDSILKKKIADSVLATGLVTHVILLAKGILLGKPSVDLIKKKNLEGYIDQSRTLLKTYGPKIRVPLDFAYVVDEERKEVMVCNLPIDQSLLDLGQKTMEFYASIIKEVKTLFFNGPAGIFEKKETGNRVPNPS